MPLTWKRNDKGEWWALARDGRDYHIRLADPEVSPNFPLHVSGPGFESTHADLRDAILQCEKVEASRPTVQVGLAMILDEAEAVMRPKIERLTQIEGLYLAAIDRLQATVKRHQIDGLGKSWAEAVCDHVDHLQADLALVTAEQGKKIGRLTAEWDQWKKDLQNLSLAHTDSEAEWYKANNRLADELARRQEECDKLTAERDRLRKELDEARAALEQPGSDNHIEWLRNQRDEARREVERLMKELASAKPPVPATMPSAATLTGIVRDNCFPGTDWQSHPNLMNSCNRAAEAILAAVAAPITRAEVRKATVAFFNDPNALIDCHLESTRRALKSLGLQVEGEEVRPC